MAPKKPTKKAPAKKPAAKPAVSAPAKKTVNPQACEGSCVLARFFKGLFVFIVDLIWFVVDILHAVGFVIAALIAAVALLIASMGVFLHFIGVQESAEFVKLRENMIHIESISRTPDMMRAEYQIMNDIVETEQEISDMREPEASTDAE